MSNDLVKLIGAAAVSVALLGLGSYVLLHGGNATLEKAATGWIGLVAGYWLR